MAIFTKKGSEVRHDRPGALRPGEHEQLLQGLRRAVRSDEQRRRRRPLRPARRPLADRDAALPARRPFAGRTGAGKTGEPVQSSLTGAAEPARAGRAARFSRRHRRPRPPARPRGQRGRGGQPRAAGLVSMCYAISTSPDPLGSYYRYEFLRPLFPDYPRPAVWPDGYYVPTSTGDDVIQKHACVVERAKMLKGEPATEQCVIIDDVEFPQQRRPRRQGAAAGRRAEHHDGRRRDAAEEGPRRRRHLRVEVPRRLERSREDEGRRARRRSRSRRITTCAAASSRTACRSRAPSAGWTRRATRSWRGSCIAGSATASRSSRCIP